MLSLELSNNKGKKNYLIISHPCYAKLKCLILILFAFMQEKDYSICDIYGNICFKDLFEKGGQNKSCDCPRECDSISYSYSLVSTPFDRKVLCSNSDHNLNPLMGEFYEHPFPNSFVRKLRFFTQNVSDDANFNCEKNIQYRAEIIFKLATNDMPVTVSSRRLSFFDKVSAFGKD